MNGIEWNIIVVLVTIVGFIVFYIIGYNKGYWKGYEEGENRPKITEELCNYILQQCDKIAVREQVDGKWKSVFLTELPPKLAIKHALRFVKEGRTPVIVQEGEKRNEL